MKAPDLCSLSILVVITMVEILETVDMEGGNMEGAGHGRGEPVEETGW